MLEPFQLPFVQRGLVELLILSLGAGVLGTWIVLRGLALALVFAGSLERLARARRSGYDSLTALVLVGALALGVILASDVFYSGSNVETLLFGSPFVIGGDDLLLAALASGLALAASAALGRAWLATGFDPDAARSLGLRSPLPDA